MEAVGDGFLAGVQLQEIVFLAEIPIALSALLAVVGDGLKEQVKDHPHLLLRELIVAGLGQKSQLIGAVAALRLPRGDRQLLNRQLVVYPLFCL